MRFSRLHYMGRGGVGGWVQAERKYHNIKDYEETGGHGAVLK
jgi:hypothetical protein